MSNIDFITGKWMTIRRARHLASFHIISIVLIMVYVAAHPGAQHSKGYDAALVAVFFKLIHFVRTNTGVVQVNAVLEWRKEVMACINALRCIVEWSNTLNQNKNQKNDLPSDEGSELGSVRIMFSVLKKYEMQ